MNIHLTRRSKIISGVIVVLVAAVLVVGFGTGLPGTGQKLVGAAVEYSGSSRILMSDWGGLATGWITLRNDGNKRAELKSYSNSWGQWSSNYWGVVGMDPGETRSFDFKGYWKVTAIWNEVKTSRGGHQTLIRHDNYAITTVAWAGQGGGKGEGGLNMVH